MVAHTYNPNTQEAQARRQQVLGQPGLHSKTLSQNKKWKQINEGRLQILHLEILIEMH
jgi:hypothetical protein